MGRVSSFKPFKLIMGILSSFPQREAQLEEMLTKHYGPVDLKSRRWDFTFTRFYTKEMGEHIQRYFLSFSDLIDPSQLSEIKLFTNRLEENFLVDGNRNLNIDPGIMCSDRLILATTKDRGHRVPLQYGIYGEVTLVYMKGNFSPLPWTYPDYSSGAYWDFLLSVRNKYMEDIQ